MPVAAAEILTDLSQVEELRLVAVAVDGAVVELMLPEIQADELTGPGAAEAEEDIHHHHNHLERFTY